MKRLLLFIYKIFRIKITIYEQSTEHSNEQSYTLRVVNCHKTQKLTTIVKQIKIIQFCFGHQSVSIFNIINNPITILYYILAIFTKEVRTNKIQAFIFM